MFAFLEPHSSIRDHAEQRRARLLIALLALFTLAASSAPIMRWLVVPQSVTGARLVASAVAGSCLGLSWWLARSPHWQRGAILAGWCSAAVLWTFSARLPPGDGVLLLSYLPLVLFLVAAFASSKHAWVFAGVNLVVLLLAPGWLDLAHPNTASVFIFIVIGTGFVGVVSYLMHRDMDDLKRLRGLVPVCSWCSNVRDGEVWGDMESYIRNHSEASITHSICPNCLERQIAEADRLDT